MSIIFSTVVIIFTCLPRLMSFHIDSVATTDPVIQNSPHKRITQNYAKIFTPTNHPFSTEFVATNPYGLMNAAQDTLNFLHSVKGRTIEHSSKDYIESTLKFIISTIKKDMTSGKFRILDPSFLNKNFCFIKWNADYAEAKRNGIRTSMDGNIRITSYAIFNVHGSIKKRPSFPCALYQALDPKIVTQYTKQQVLAGILEKPENAKRVRILAWLSRDDFEDALMQGTVIVKFSNNQERMFAANLCNQIAYDKMEMNPRHQRRFWFFKECKKPKMGIDQLKKRLKLRQNVVFAGDICNIGIGKIVAIKNPNPISGKPELRLGVLADTGGAFVHNLYQLDLFAGIFNNRTELSNYLRSVPTQAQAYILYKR